MDINSLSDNVFVPVTKKRDILKVRPLTWKEKKNLPNGTKDVYCVSPLGYDGTLSRQEILDNYTYLDGSKIKMSVWKSSNWYFIMSTNKEVEATATLLPKSYTITTPKGKISNSYIIYLVNEDGSMDKRQAYIAKPAVFKKMFVMPPNDKLSACLDKVQAKKDNRLRRATNYRGQADFTSKLPGFNANSININSVNDKKPQFDFGEQDLYAEQPKSITMQKTPKNIAQPKPVIIPAPTARKQSATTVNPSIKPNNTQNKCEATHRIVNELGKTVGFVVRSNTGKIQKITSKQMMKLCDAKLVSNIMVAVTDESGKKYLRGNGMKIDSLPIFSE